MTSTFKTDALDSLLSTLALTAATERGLARVEAARAEVAALKASHAELLANLESLVNIIVTIREEQVSEFMRFGSTDAEKREKAAIYASEIKRQSLRIDGATMTSQETIKKIKGTT